MRRGVRDPARRSGRVAERQRRGRHRALRGCPAARSVRLMPGPAYRVETARLLLRCWQPGDAPLLEAAIGASLDHLRPWMPWIADEPMARAARVELLREFRGRFDLGHDFIYGIFDRGESRVLGGSGLHVRSGPEIREIGYWIHADHVGQGLATEAAGALTRVAIEVEGIP